MERSGDRCERSWRVQVCRQKDGKVERWKELRDICVHLLVQKIIKSLKLLSAWKNEWAGGWKNSGKCRNRWEACFLLLGFRDYDGPTQLAIDRSEKPAEVSLRWGKQDPSPYEWFHIYMCIHTHKDMHLHTEQPHTCIWCWHTYSSVEHTWM